MIELVVRLVFSLAVVVGMLLMLAKLSSKRFRGGSKSMVQVLHRQQLSRGSSVAVVTVGSRVLVLGTTDQQVQLITELDPQEVESTEAVLKTALESAPPAPATTAVPTLVEVQAEAEVAALADASTADAAVQAALTSVPADKPHAAFAAALAAELAQLNKTGQQAPPVAPVAPVAAPAVTAGRHAAPSVAAELIAEETVSPAPGKHAKRPAPKAAKAERSSTARKVAAARVSRQNARSDTALAGSLLSPQTWKQAYGAVSGRAEAS